jgi:hypothetical protein
MEKTGTRRSPDITFEFTKDPGAPRAARAALEPLFRSNEMLAADVGLVASELVSNVVMHTHLGGRLDAWNNGAIRLEVRDHDPTLPTPGNTGHEVLGGRGLHIVDGVAARWGSAQEDDGKLIWAEFSR